MLQFVAEADFFDGAFFPGRGRDAEARVAGTDELHEPFGVTLERLGGLGEVEPFFEDGMRTQGRELGEQAGLVFVKGADEHALPRFALGGEEEVVEAVQHDGAAAEPGFQDERGFIDERIGEPLERVLGLGGARTDGGGAGRFHADGIAYWL